MGRLRRNVRRTRLRFRNVGVAGFAGTAWRALLLSIDAPRPTRPAARPVRSQRLVVTLTTIPERASGLRTVLRSLLDQSEPADRIILALPERSRTGEPYPDPERLGLPDGVEVIRCEDLGPATKLLPALHLEPDAALIVVDDDVIYPRRFLEALLQTHRAHSGAAIGYRGVRLQRGVRFADLEHIFATSVAEATAVDVLFGTWGYLLPPRVLPDAVHDLSSGPPELRFVDDVWISGHLARAGVPRLVARAGELPLETLMSYRAALTSGHNRSGHNDEVGLRFFSDAW